VNSAERVPLSGEELKVFERLQEEDFLRQQEVTHRHLREKELTTLIGGGAGGEELTGKGGMNLISGGGDGDVDADDTSDESGDSDSEEDGDVEYIPEEAANGEDNSTKKRKQKDDKRLKNKAKKTKSIGRIAQYATPRFQMFETRELRHLPEYMDEYGLDNSDLTFTEVVTSTSLVPKQGKIHRTKATTSTGDSLALAVAARRAEEEALLDDLDEVLDPHAPPSKIVSTPTRVQLTCAFKEIPPSAWGRLDFKGVKTLINKCAPKHLILLHGGNNVTHSSPTGHVRGLTHMKKVIEYARKAMGATRVFAPEVNQAVHLQVSERNSIICEYVACGNMPMSSFLLLWMCEP
jgi:hypothetical protein